MIKRPVDNISARSAVICHDIFGVDNIFLLFLYGIDV